MIQVHKVAGMSMKGGRRDQFFFCLLEEYPNEDRWFLRSVLQVKDEEELGGDDAIRLWIEQFELKSLILDFPLTEPICQRCELECPGVAKCHNPEFVTAQSKIGQVLTADRMMEEKNPKAYEYMRNLDDAYDHLRSSMDKDAQEPLLSRSFKRRLKKGFLPYWNRVVDFWVWSYYYDQLLDLFNISYDSFGNTSLMILARFQYLRHHFPKELKLYEANVPLVLIELLRSGIINNRDISHLSDIDLGVEARLDIIKKVEKELNVFIYEEDLEVVVKNPRAFDSFLLAIAGMNRHLKYSRELPKWIPNERDTFVVPSFGAP